MTGCVLTDQSSSGGVSTIGQLSLNGLLHISGIIFNVPLCLVCGTMVFKCLPCFCISVTGSPLPFTIINIDQAIRTSEETMVMRLVPNVRPQ